MCFFGTCFRGMPPHPLSMQRSGAIQRVISKLDIMELYSKILAWSPVSCPFLTRDPAGKTPTGWKRTSSLPSGGVVRQANQPCQLVSKACVGSKIFLFPQRLVFDLPVFHPLIDPVSGELDVKRAFAKWRLVRCVRI